MVQCSGSTLCRGFNQIYIAKVIADPGIDLNVSDYEYNIQCGEETWHSVVIASLSKLNMPVHERTFSRNR